MVLLLPLLFACHAKGPAGSAGADSDTCASAAADTDPSSCTLDPCLSGPTSGGQQRNAAGACVSPLDCSDASACPSEAEAEGWEVDGTGCSTATCCDLTVVTCANRYATTAYYFDTSGALIGEYSTADAPDYCTDDGGSTTIALGQQAPAACR